MLDKLKEVEQRKLILIVVGVIVLAVAAILAVKIVMGVVKDAKPEDTSTGIEGVALDSDTPTDEELKSEPEAENLAKNSEDALTAIGLPNMYTIQSNPQMVAEYTKYVEHVEPLLNGLSVGYSVMHSVFSDIESMTGVEALQMDFESSIPEYQTIFEKLAEAPVTEAADALNKALVSQYIVMYNLRKEEVSALVEANGKMMIDYAKVSVSKDEVNAHYQQILDVHKALNDITGVYIGDGLGLN